MKNGLLRALVSASALVLLSASSTFASVQPTAAVVPEPASMTLLALGAAGTYLVNRRRS